MKNIFLLLLLLNSKVNAQVFVAEDNKGSDETSILQAAFNEASTRTVLISSADIVINGTLNIPAGKMFRFENGFFIKGHGVINGGNYDAGYNSQLACEVSDCSFDFAYQSQAGVQTLLSSYGQNIVFRSCNFRYYGSKDTMLMKGNCVFEHCYFSGTIKGR